jgi:hypothetical protein
MTIPSEFEVRDQREAGWFYTDNEIIDIYGSRIGAYGVGVYAVLSRHEKNHRVRLSQRDIAASLGISQDRVRKSLVHLAELGLIHIDIPEHPSAGLISTIALLKVKKTERHALSSSAEVNATRSVHQNTERHAFSLWPGLNATRSPNKEEDKNQTKYKQRCATCDGEGQLLQRPEIPGPRLIPCPDCTLQAGASA